MFAALIIFLVMTSPLTVWLFAIRPYCVKNRMGYTPGAGWDVTMWIDWQEAKELAAKRGDRRMKIWCRVFLSIKLCFAAIGLLAFVGALAMA